MKIPALKLLLIAILISSCDPKLAGPVGDIFSDEYYFKLERFRVKGRDVSIEEAPRFSYLSFTKRYDKPDSSRFNFFGPKIDSAGAWEVWMTEFDVSKSFKRGYYIMKTKGGKFFKVVVSTVPSTGNILNLEMGALMDGSYRKENDTLNYLYYPVQRS